MKNYIRINSDCFDTSMPRGSSLMLLRIRDDFFDLKEKNGRL